MAALTLSALCSQLCRAASGAGSEQELSPVHTLSGTEGSHPTWSLLSPLTLWFCVGEAPGISFLVRNLSNVNTF